MKLLNSDIHQTHPIMVQIDANYLAYLHTVESKVSLKKDRPFVGLAACINGKMFVIPLTSQTTQERKKKGLNKRNSLTTTFIKASNVEISNLLHNNMIPVPENLATKITIDPMKDTYLNNKSIMIYLQRYDQKSRNHKFLQSICCDFRLLEEKCDEWIKNNPIK